MERQTQFNLWYVIFAVLGVLWLREICQRPDGQALNGNGTSSVAKLTKEAIWLRYSPRLRPKATSSALGVSLSSASTNWTMAPRASNVPEI